MWQLLSHNGGVFRRANVLLKTTELPAAGEVTFETCLFTSSGWSEVLDQHKTVAEAIEFHTKKTKELGLKLGA